MSNIRFRSAAHRDFFLEMMNKSKVNDCYHRAFFYVMGIAAETRANINQMFDFKTDVFPIYCHSAFQRETPCKPTNSITDYLYHSSDDDCSDTVIFQIASYTKIVCGEQHRTLFCGLFDISCVQCGINGNVE